MKPHPLSLLIAAACAVAFSPGARGADPDKATLVNSDRPFMPADTHEIQANAAQGSQTWPVTVRYQWDKSVMMDDFRLWLGVADVVADGFSPNPAVFVPIRQADQPGGSGWHLHADSSANGLQEAAGGTDKEPDTVPVVSGKTANQSLNYQWQNGNQNTTNNP